MAVETSVPSSLQIPITVERLVVVLPKTYDRDYRGVYRRLEAGAFGLKSQRPVLRILDRSDLSATLTEQQLQIGGAVRDDTAIKIGHIVGADTVVVFHVDGPNLKDRLLARLDGNMPPLSVITKVINVESAEVLYFNIVTVSFPSIESDAPFFQGQPLLRAAVDRGVAQSLSDLQYAFRSSTQH
jgi:hypothetical protein